jgi:hypothetical protein
MTILHQTDAKPEQVSLDVTPEFVDDDEVLLGSAANRRLTVKITRQDCLDLLAKMDECKSI